MARKTVKTAENWGKLAVRADIAVKVTGVEVRKAIDERLEIEAGLDAAAAIERGPFLVTYDDKGRPVLNS